MTLGADDGVMVGIGFNKSSTEAWFAGPHKPGVTGITNEFHISRLNGSWSHPFKIEPGGDVIVNNAFRQNDVGRVCNSGYTSGNASFFVDYTVTIQSSLKVTAVFNHYGYINAYGCARYSMVGLGPGISDINIKSETSGNGGNWAFSRVNNTTLRVTKNAGTYGGAGYWFIEVIGAQVH